MQEREVLNVVDLHRHSECSTFDGFGKPEELAALAKKLGHSSLVAFYSDGDGDFRPTFDIDREYKKTRGFWKKLDNQLPVPEVIFDAGL